MLLIFQLRFINRILAVAVGGVLITIVLVSVAAILTLIMIKRQQKKTTEAALNKRFPQAFQSQYESEHLLQSEESS